MNANSNHDEYQIVRSSVRDRKTLKVLGSVNDPVHISVETATLRRKQVMDAIADAGWAPFHYDRGVDGIAEPWRAHVLWHDTCQTVAANFLDWFEGVKPNNKLPAMLSACGAAVVVNWLPQNDLSQAAEKSRLINEEHLAASSAMVQNLLLLLTSSGMGTYWSSGGQFRSQEMFEKLGMNPDERLLAVVFVEFPESFSERKDRLPGKHRENRSAVDQWTRVVELT